MSPIDYDLRRKVGVALDHDDVDALRTILAGVDHAEVERVAMAAAISGANRAIRYLVGELGARVIRDREHSLIAAAVRWAPIELVKYLLSRPLEADYGLYVGLPLWGAVDRRRLDVVQLLVAAGVDVNQGNRGFQNPLELAMSKGFDEIAEYLRAHGARPGVHNNVP